MNKKVDTPLIEALEHQKRLNTVPFHMPGHKKGKGASKKLVSLMQPNPFSVDLTEIPGLDDLHRPTGPIKNAQTNAARLFGADKTFFLVNGTTGGIHAAVLSVAGQDEEILLPRDVHRSVIGACILAGVRPKYIPSRLDKHFMIPYPTNPHEVRTALEQFKEIKAVFQTYPSYYGLAGDLSLISEIVHDKNIPLVVDEAHGPHCKFSSILPLTALACGADISIQSTHKTLGAFTQASMLHIKGDLVDPVKVQSNLRLLQTTSPSYMLLASLDAVVGQMASEGENLIEGIVEISCDVRKKLNNISGIRCLGSEMTGKNGVFSVDPTKLLISFRDTGLTGYQAAQILLEKYGIQVEFSDVYNVLCIFSIGNTYKDAELLVKAVTEMLEDSFVGIKKRESLLELDYLPQPKAAMPPREAWFASKQMIPIDDAVGKVSGEFVAPYPPGIPLLCPGEVINNCVLEVIRYLRDAGASFQGPQDQSLSKLSVVSR